MPSDPSTRARTQAERAAGKKAGKVVTPALVVSAAVLLMVLAQPRLPTPDTSAVSEAQQEKPEEYTRGHLVVDCQRAVRARLKYPEEAEFVDSFIVGANGEIEQIANGGMQWTSEVVSKNSFGVRSKLYFTCVHHAGANDVTVLIAE